MKYVTREFITTKITVKVIEIDSEKVKEEVFENMTIPAIRREVERDGTFKFLCVVSQERSKELYGLPVDEFKKQAIQLNTKTRKPINND